MLNLEFDDNGEKFILNLSEKLNRNPGDTVKTALTLLKVICENVAGRGRTTAIRDASFALYKEVIISPGERVTKETITDLFDLLNKPRKDEPAE